METATNDYIPGAFDRRDHQRVDRRIADVDYTIERRRADRRRLTSTPTLLDPILSDPNVQESVELNNIYPLFEDLGQYNDILSTVTAAQPQTISLDLSDGTTVDRLRQFNGKLRVRPVEHTEKDLKDLVNLEFAAYTDVYGTQISNPVYKQVTDKFSERIEVLDDWITVIEDSESHNIAGMLVACPTDKNPDQLLEHDMTSADALSEVYNPDGTNLYVINMVTHPDAPRDLRFMLFADLASKGLHANKRKVYFESRLPGLGKWMEDNGQDNDTLSILEKDALAEVYFRETKDYHGKSLPIDKLLRLYAQIGAKPLRLVPEAWQADKPSSSYGVLCEYDNPLPANIARIRLVRELAAKAIGIGANHKRVIQMAVGAR